MENKKVKIGKVYRHFKGNYYFVENIGLSSETSETLIIYKPLYIGSDASIWVRPEKAFFDDVSSNPANITGQKYRFELAENLEKNYIN